MFRGRFEHTLDAKGRLALPASFRRSLQEIEEDTLMVTNHLMHPCLVAAPMSEWLRFERKLAEQPQFDPRIDMVRRIYVGGAHECPIDKQGRLLLPPSLRNHAKLARDVLSVGCIKNIEIWSADCWQSEVESRREEVTPELLHQLGALGL